MTAVRKCEECGKEINPSQKHACVGAAAAVSSVVADVGSSILEGIGSVLDVTGGAIGSAAEVAGDVFGAAAEVAGAVFSAAVGD